MAVQLIMVVLYNVDVAGPDRPETFQSRISHHHLHPPLLLLLPLTFRQQQNFLFERLSISSRMKQLQQQQNHHQRTADVVIVGAGMAGLAAADRLRQAGINSVVILEASSRLALFFFWNSKSLSFAQWKWRIRYSILSLPGHVSRPSLDIL